MKSLVVGAMTAALLWWATPASAYLEHVSTSIEVADAADETAVTQALQRAVDDLVKQGIGFEPTLVIVTRAVLRDGRLYVRLLVADDEGARQFRDGTRDLVAESGI